MKVIFEMRKILNPINKSGVYVLLVIIGICMIYPLLWLIVSSVRPNQEIFVNIGLIPSRVIVDSYINGWQGSGQYTYARFFTIHLNLFFRWFYLQLYPVFLWPMVLPDSDFLLKRRYLL